jgi:RNA polymerase sigma factor (sigma-70 family)
MMSDHNNEARRDLENALANLPWVQREVFRLHAVEAYSYAEIAWLLRTNERTVEHQMARAIYKLSKQMEGHPLSWSERWF